MKENGYNMLWEADPGYRINCRNKKCTMVAKSKSINLGILSMIRGVKCPACGDKMGYYKTENQGDTESN